MMLQKLKGLVIFLHIIFALYFLNYPFNIIEIPEAISAFDSWIIFVGGLLILIGGVNYFRAGRRYY